MFKRIVQVSLVAMVLSLFTPIANATPIGNGAPFTVVLPGQLSTDQCPAGYQGANGIIVAIGDGTYTECWPANAWTAWRIGGTAWERFKSSGGTYDPAQDVRDEENFRNAVAAATAAAEVESKAWNTAHPGQQKCVQWGPIVHANGVSTSSGGVCANPVGSLPSGVDTSTSTPSVDTRTSTPSVDTTTTTPTQTPYNGTGGYAVVHPDGHVCGVIVANSSDPFGNGGTMPQEYMGCPSGSRIVFQTKPSADGNVAGVHGENVVYNNGVFTVLGSDSKTATTIVNGVATDSSGRKYDAGSGQALDPLPNIANGTMLAGTKISSAPGQSQSSWEATSAYKNMAACPVGSGRAIEVNLNFTTDRSDDVYSTYCVKNWNGSYSNNVVGTPLADSMTATTKLDTSTATTTTKFETTTAQSDTTTATLTKSGIPDPVKEELQLNIAMVGLRSKIAIETDVANSKLVLTAKKKGSKTITINVKTDKEGDAAVSTAKNLKGFTVTLTKGKVILDKDVVR